MGDVIKKELTFFFDNYSSLFEKYKYEWVAIKNSEVIAHSQDKDEVLNNVLGEHELGTFLFKKVVPQHQYVHKYFSRVP